MQGMGIQEAVDLYGTLGATGIISITFLYLISNLIRENKAQSEAIDEIQTSMSAMQSEINNTMNICVKLIDSINAFKHDINDKLDRRHERLNESLDDLEKSVNYMQGRLNGK